MEVAASTANTCLYLSVPSLGFSFGSGKSSLVRAGLIPALKRGKPLADGSLPPASSAQWPVHIITPTARPLEALAAYLTRDEESVTTTAGSGCGMRTPERHYSP